MIPSIVLAAGLSERMGRPKAALPLPGGATFLSRIVESLASGGTTQIVVVTGRDANDVRDAASIARVLVPVAFIGNPNTARGQLSSVVCGLTALPKDIEAALVTLADVPMPRPETIRTLIKRWEAGRSQLVRPTRGGRHGHPFVVGREILDVLRTTRLDLTMRDVIQPWVPGDELEITDDDGPFEDVDTPEEYERLMKRLGRK